MSTPPAVPRPLPCASARAVGLVHHLVPTLLAALGVGTAGASFSGPYLPENWSSGGISGGTTSISPSAGAAQSLAFGYAVTLGGGGVSPRTATFSATPVPAGGTVRFDYVYEGFHAYFLARAEFEVLVNGVVALDLVNGVGVSGPFRFSGAATLAVNAGDTLALRIGGQNFDSTSVLNGSLRLANFTGPPTVVVTSNAGSGAGSLRQAINTAPSGATITFDPAVFGGGVANTISLASELTIPNKTLTIDAGAVCGVTLKASGTSRVIGNASGGILTLDSLGITGGGGVVDGGGIYNGAGSSLTLLGCSIHGNSATNSGGGVNNGSPGTLRMVNCTVHGNTAGQFSGGIENNGGAATATILSCSIVRNTGGVQGIGGLGNNGGSITLGNTIIAHNASPIETDIYAAGTWTFAGPNLIRDNTGGFTAGNPNADGNLVGTAAAPLEPRLVGDAGGAGPALIDNGGATPTILLLPGSPAIDAGTAGPNVPAIDQRGVARVGNPDIGATEPSWGANLTATAPPPPVADITTPGDPVGEFPAGSGFPPGESPVEGIDNNPSSRFLSAYAVNAGLDTTPSLGACRLVGLRLTAPTENSPNRDPKTFLLLGSHNGRCFTPIAAGVVPDFAARGATQEFFLAGPSPPYQHFRVIIPNTRLGAAPLFSENLAVAEVQLLGAPLDQSLRITNLTVAKELDGNNVRPWSFTWASIPGKTYSFQYDAANPATSAIDFATWITGHPAAGDGFRTTYTTWDPPRTSNFFRIVEE